MFYRCFCCCYCYYRFWRQRHHQIICFFFVLFLCFLCHSFVLHGILLHCAHFFFVRRSTFSTLSSNKTLKLIFPTCCFDERWTYGWCGCCVFFSSYVSFSTQKHKKTTYIHQVKRSKDRENVNVFPVLHQQNGMAHKKISERCRKSFVLAPTLPWLPKIVIFFIYLHLFPSFSPLCFIGFCNKAA